jgi:hypothetical protein
MNQTVTCARGAFLDTWSGHHWQDGVQVDGFEDLSRLVVRTENSTYEITIICGRTGEILVRGGRFFPEFTAARLAGSSLGGSFLKVRGIYVGFNIEINVESRTIITSRVRTIEA